MSADLSLLVALAIAAAAITVLLLIVRRKENYPVKEKPPLWVSMVIVAVVTLFLGCLLIRELPFGYTECALLYLSAVIAVSACYVGRDR